MRPEPEPTPTIVLSEVTSCIGPGSVSIPCTWMTRGPDCAIADRNADAVVTVTVGPPAPPVVPFWPQALTDAQPSATLGAGGLVGLGPAGIRPVGSLVGVGSARRRRWSPRRRRSWRVV